MILSDEPY